MIAADPDRSKVFWIAQPPGCGRKGNNKGNLAKEVEKLRHLPDCSCLPQADQNRLRQTGGAVLQVGLFFLWVIDREPHDGCGAGPGFANHLEPGADRNVLGDDPGQGQ